MGTRSCNFNFCANTHVLFSVYLGDQAVFFSIWMKKAWIEISDQDILVCRLVRVIFGVLNRYLINVKGLEECTKYMYDSQYK